jgi:PT repeat
VPTAAPTEAPTDAPTNAPTASPTGTPTEVPTTSPTLMPTTSPTCRTDEIFYFMDFEGASINSQTGWENGILNNDLNCTHFTNFLGRYSGDGRNALPRRKFSDIPLDALNIVFEFDFYEIDSWDGFFIDDSLKIQINNETTHLGRFQFDRDEGEYTIVAGDIIFTVKSLGPPVKQCFGDWLDQKHHVTLTLPRRLFATDGTLDVTFIPFLDQDLNDESSGFDNIKITAHWQC